jgi:D-lactate dehydrogenase
LKVGVFSSQRSGRAPLLEANHGVHELTFHEARLDGETADVGAQFQAVCVFVNDLLPRSVLERLRAGATRLIALRCAGFDNVDVAAAAELGLTVVRVPAYSPYSVAEFALGLIMTLNRKLHRSYARVRDSNFSLAGLEGFEVHSSTVGVIGTGGIGAAFCHIMQGFGCRLLAYDLVRNPACEKLGVEYVSLDEIWAAANVISLHCPLTPQTRHVINADTLARMRRGVMIVNTGRGGLLDTRAAIAALKTGQLGYLGMDVYEGEGGLYFQDRSDEILVDDVLTRLFTFPNVVVTAHQAFFTREAIASIAATTVENITSFERGAGPIFRVAA